MNVSRSKKFTDFTMDELFQLAARSRLPEKLVLDTAKETVFRFHESWQKEKNNLALGSGVIEAIEQHLETLPIATLK